MIGSNETDEVRTEAKSCGKRFLSETGKESAIIYGKTCVVLRGWPSAAGAKMTVALTAESARNGPKIKELKSLFFRKSRFF
jgi:hypothetical protein